MKVQNPETLLQALSDLVRKHRGQDPLQNNQKIILTDDELSDLFKISKVTLYRFRRDNKLSYQKVGNLVSYYYDDVMVALRTARITIKGMTKPEAIEVLTNYKKIMEL